MNVLIPTLSSWGDSWCALAAAVFWQSTILIGALLLLDFFLTRRLAPSTRYLLWLLVLVKLVMPPSFAAPSGVAWWLRPAIKTVPSPRLSAHGVKVVVSPAANRFVPPPLANKSASQSLRWPGAALLLQGAGSVAMCLLLLRHTRKLRRLIATSHAPKPVIRDLFQQTKQRCGCRGRLRLLVTNSTVSPALYGLFRPVVVLPMSVIERLTTSELEAILVHEIQHFRRGDVWISLVQTTALIVFWWHPMLWVAHSRTRSVREEAVDQAVLRYMHGASESYAETLLNVARLCLVRNSCVAGFVGMVPSRRALSTRVERIVSEPPLALSASVSLLLLLALAALLLPMGRAQEQSVDAAAFPLQQSQQLAQAVDSRHTEIPSGLPSFKPINKDLFHGTVETGGGLRPVGQPGRTATTDASGFAKILHGESQGTTNSGPYYTRIMRTDAATFTHALFETLGPLPDGETNCTPMLKRLLESMGINVNPPFTCWYNDKTGDLVVHATQPDIDAVETAVQVLNTAPPMLNIKAKFIELPTDTRALESLSWFSAAKASSPPKPEPGQQPSGIAISPAEFNQTLRILEQAKAQLLNQANVTTLSGRQTQIQVSDEITVVNGIRPAALTLPGISSAGDGASASFTTESKQVGPTLDIIPYVNRWQHSANHHRLYQQLPRL
jgi:beta-lactamase regulating signal transducer with metallopeptidase domain